MDITFTGYYGMQNYGDDLFGVLSTYGARKWWPNSTPKILAPAISGHQEVFTIPRIVPAEIYSRTDIIGKTIRSIFALREMSNGGKLIFSGGSLFSSNRSKIFETLATNSRRKSKSLAAMGVSIGPFDSISSEKSLISFLRQFDYISTRDLSSFEKLESYSLNARIANCRDLAGIAPLAFSDIETHHTPKRYIGYASCHLFNDKLSQNSFDEIFIQAIKRRQDLPVKVFNLNSHQKLGDMRHNAYVYERLRESGVQVELVDYSKIGVLRTWKEIASCKAMVSIRLHGAISAYLQGIPFILYEYHKKCGDFLDDIGQQRSLRVGLEDKSTIEHQTRLFSNQLEMLLDGGFKPSLSRETYSLEASKNFTEAPWH